MRSSHIFAVERSIKRSIKAIKCLKKHLGHKKLKSDQKQEQEQQIYVKDPEQECSRSKNHSGTTLIISKGVSWLPIIFERNGKYSDPSRAKKLSAQASSQGSFA